ncbi:MAG: TIGR03986 family CRISPR-associated RAMP protein [Succinimonas sp.]|nr:TIGR03986 family CRISPR-associated RAMP protein [Succinimonas sp.]
MANYTKIVTPYDFVPISSWVFSPDWANDVTHDVPFQDGISGRIDYELMNYSPLCVGHDSVNKTDANGKTVKTLLWEHDGSGRQVIPGSSIKGMLRNALEIVGFGKMQCVRDLRHAIRLSIGEVKSENADYRLTPIFVRRDPRILGNWQYLEAVAIPDNKPVTASVNAASLGNILGISPNQAKGMTAQEKHRALARKLGLSDRDPMPLLYAALESRKGLSPEQKKKEDPADRRYTTWNEVTSVSLKADNKHNCPGMFLFMNENISNNGKAKKANLYTDYFFYVNDKAVAERYENWKLLEDWLIRDLNASLPAMKADDAGAKDQNLFDYNQSRRHPVFGFPVWLLEHKSDHKRSALGFCQVTRHVRQKSVLDMIRDVQKDTANIKDLADIMFGYITDTEGSGSRIGFSDLIAEQKYPTETHTYILGEPKSTFSPAYLGKFNFKEEYNEGSIIAGRKVYKIRKDFKMAEPKFPNDNTDVRSAAEFVVPKSKFHGSVVFHNMKPEELGALLWVMTHGVGADAAASPFYHSLGHARPMGAGAVKLNVTPESITVPPYLMKDGEIDLGTDIQGNEQKCAKENLIRKCLERFEAMMNFEYPFRDRNQLGKWRNSKIITFFLDKAKIDAACEPSKVYNEFPDEFTSIHQDYTNKPTAKQHPGYGNGKQTGPACEVFKIEKDKLAQGLALVKQEKEELIQEARKAAAEAEKMERERLEKEAAKEAENQALGSEYQQHLDAGNHAYLSAMALVNASIKDTFDKDLASGKIAAEWNCSNVNKLLKQINKSYESDPAALNKCADEVYKLLSGNADTLKEVDAYVKKNKGKKGLPEVLKALRQAS